MIGHNYIKEVGIDTIVVNSHDTIDAIVKMKMAYGVDIIHRNDMGLGEFHFEDNDEFKVFFINNKTDINTIFESLMLCIYYNIVYTLADIDNSIYNKYGVITQNIINSIEHLDFEYSKVI